MIKNILNFLEEAKLELQKVNWPSRADTIKHTLFVAGFSLAMAVLLGFFDFVFLYVLETFIF